MNKHRNSVADSNKTYVQYGCGLCAPDQWYNFDSSPRLRFERLPGMTIVTSLIGKRLFPRNVKFGNIVQGLPIEAGSVDAVYSSHVLEHVGRDEVGAAIANSYKLLRAGGVFRFIVPDLEWRAKRYLNGSEDNSTDGNQPADDFIASCNFGQSKRPRGPMALLRAAYGNSGHMWMYDEKVMFALLRDAGFKDIRRCSIGDSGDEMFNLVEDEGRFIDSGEPELAIEAYKP